MRPGRRGRSPNSDEVRAARLPRRLGPPAERTPHPEPPHLGATRRDVLVIAFPFPVVYPDPVRDPCDEVPPLKVRPWPSRRDHPAQVHGPETGGVDCVGARSEGVSGSAEAHGPPGPGLVYSMQMA